MQDITTLRKLFTLFFLGFLLVAGGYVGAWLFLMHKIDGVLLGRALIERRLAQEEDFPSVRELQLRVGSQAGDLNEQFVVPGNEVEFIEGVESLARTSGVAIEIKAVNPESEEIEGSSFDREVITLDVLAIGSWRGLFHFLSLLENARPYMRIDRFQFEYGSLPGDSEAEGWRGLFVISAIMYEDATSL